MAGPSSKFSRALSAHCMKESTNASSRWRGGFPPGFPQRHAQAIKEMCQRHRLFVGNPRTTPVGEATKMRMRFDPSGSWRLRQISAGGDLFSAQFNGSTIAAEFSSLGVTIRPANPNRVQGWAEI